MVNGLTRCSRGHETRQIKEEVENDMSTDP